MKRKQKTTQILDLRTNLKKNFFRIDKSFTIKKMLDKSAYVCMKHRLEKSHK